MIYGYARVSTKGQAKDGNSLEAQETSLRQAGAEKIYMDAFTGTKAHRPELDRLLDTMKDGDTLIVTKLDRIARSATKGIELIQSLLDRGICVHVLNMGLMDNTPTGKLIRNVKDRFIHPISYESIADIRRIIRYFFEFAEKMDSSCRRFFFCSFFAQHPSRE